MWRGKGREQSQAGMEVAQERTGIWPETKRGTERAHCSLLCGRLPPPLRPHSLPPILRTVTSKQPSPFILYSGGIKITTKTLQKSLRELMGPFLASAPELPGRGGRQERGRKGNPGSVGISKDEGVWIGDWGPSRTSGVGWRLGGF